MSPDGVSTMYDLGIHAGCRTLPGTFCWSVVTTTSDPSEISDCSLVLCPRSKSSFCFSLNFPLSFLNSGRYDQLGISC